MGSGTYNGVNILGRKTVEFMRTNCLTPEQMKTLDWDSMKGHGYGNFMRVLTSPVEAGFNAGAGEYGWDGWMGCYFLLILTKILHSFSSSSRQIQAALTLQESSRALYAAACNIGDGLLCGSFLRCCRLFLQR